MKKIYFSVWRGLGLLGFLGLFLPAWGQLNVTSGSPFRTYADETLESEGIDIYDVVINCDTLNTPPQMGRFDDPAGTSSVNLDSGLLMTTGEVDFALPSATGGGAIVGTPGDSTIDSIIGSNTNDACVVSFKFQAQCDTVRMRYVFGSNEYPSFVGSFEDAFIAQITGPGFAANTNVALVPGTALPVTITNINANTNAAFHNANPVGVGYNEHSVVLEAVIPVQPCTEYSMRLSVADEGDASFDTGVFIEPLDCNVVGPSILARNVSNPANDTAYEQCADGMFTFFPTGGCLGSGGGADTVDRTIYFELAGTATNGLDYQISQDSVLIPAGIDSVNLLANVVTDGIPENTETVVLNVLDSLGNLIQDSVAILFIKDVSTFEAIAGPDQNVCSGRPAQLGPAVIPPAGTSYDWEPSIGMIGPLNSFNPTVGFSTNVPQQFSYFVEAVSPDGCLDNDTVVATFLPKPEATIVLAEDTICTDEFGDAIYGLPPQPSYTYNWDFGAGLNQALGSGAGNYLLDYNTAGDKTIRLSVDNGTCVSDTAAVTLRVNPIPTPAFTLADTVCVNEFTELVYSGSATPGATYTWDLGNASPSTVSGPGPHFIQWSGTGFQQVSLTVEENGCVSTTETQTALVVPQPVASFTLPDSICAGELLTINYNGPSGPSATYDWNFGNAIVLSGSGAGPYQLYFPTPGSKSVCLQVGEGDCLSPVLCRDLEVTGRPVVQINPVVDQCFPGNSFSFSTVGGPANVYQWDFGPSASPATFQGATPPAVSYLSPGPKTVRLVTFGNGCQSTDTATVSFEVVAPPSANFTTSSNSLCADGSVAFTYAGQVLGAAQTYFWNFGPGAVPQTSTQRNPGAVRYTSPGTRTVSLTVSFGPCTQTTTQSITVSPTPTVDAGLDKEFCEGDGGVALDATVNGGSGTYFYTWGCNLPGGNCGFDSVNVEDPKVNPDVQNPTEEVIYFLEVTDANGCVSNRDSVIVTVKAKPRLNAGRDLSICAPNAPGVFLQGSVADDNRAPQPISYQWTPSTGLSDPNALNPFARPDSTTIYTLTGTSANGCSSEATTVDSLSSMTLRVKPKPVAEAGLDTGICIGESVRLDGFASGAGPDYTYTWTASPAGSLDDPNSPNPIASPTQTTVYTLVVTSGECSSDGDTVRVQVDTKPTVNAGSDKSLCLNEPLALDARASGDPRSGSYTYQWSPATGLSDATIPNPVALPLQTTTYSVFATTEFGCVSDTQEVTLTLKPTPEVELLANDTTLCSDDSLTLRAQHSFRTAPGGPVNYHWFPARFIAEEISEDEVKFKPTESTFLVVETVISSGDCPTRDSIFVAVAPAVEATAEADTTRICEGEGTQLFSQGGRGNATYRWSPATGLSDPTLANPLASPDSTTTYVVSIEEGICVDTEEVTIEVNPSPGADYFNTLATGCGDLEVSFMENTTAAVGYEWDFGDGSPVSNEANPVHVYDQPGTYVVTFTAIGEGGCAESVSQTTVEVAAGPESTVSGLPEAGERLPVGSAIELTAPGEGIVSWLWSMGDGGAANGETVQYRYEAVGTYLVEVTVTDESGCSRTLQYGPYEIFQPEVELQNIFTPNGDGANDEFRIRYSGEGDYEVVVYDRWGRELFVSQNPDQGWLGLTPQGADAHEGVYLYTAIIGEQTYKGTVTLLR